MLEKAILTLGQAGADLGHEGLEVGQDLLGVLPLCTSLPPTCRTIIRGA